MIKSSNRPFQTSAPRALTVTGNPFVYTNNTGYLQYVAVTGGLVVVVTFMGSVLGLAAGFSYAMRPGDTMSISYTTAPSVTVLDLV